MQLSGLTSALLATAVSPVMSRNVIHQTQQPILSPQETISQPLIGFGTWNLKVSPENTTAVVSLAIETGYRQIDCAAIYGNQVAVGKGIKEGLEKVGLKREDIWVTSKLWNDHHGDYETAEAGLNQTLKDLRLDYLDLYLMHWPVGTSPNGPKLDYVDTWKSMIDLPKSKVLNIGISNFSPKQLKDIISKTGVKPAAHQMEMHPYLQQSSWLATHEALGISVTAYSPLANSNPIYDPSTSHSCHSSPSSFFSWLFGNKKNDPPTPLLKNPVLKEIAERRNCTTAQVALAWGIGRGTSVIPKSSHEQWIKEDYEAIDCQLGITDEVQLKALGVETVKRFSNPSKNWGVKLFEGLDGA